MEHNNSVMPTKVLAVAIVEHEGKILMRKSQTARRHIKKHGTFLVQHSHLIRRSKRRLNVK